MIPAFSGLVGPRFGGSPKQRSASPVCSQPEPTPAPKIQVLEDVLSVMSKRLQDPSIPIRFLLAEEVWPRQAFGFTHRINFVWGDVPYLFELKRPKNEFLKQPPFFSIRPVEKENSRNPRLTAMYALVEVPSVSGKEVTAGLHKFITTRDKQGNKIVLDWDFKAPETDYISEALERKIFETATAVMSQIEAVKQSGGHNGLSRSSILEPWHTLERV